MVQSFEQFVNERWGVFLHAEPSKDTAYISKIVNNFMDAISKHPNKSYSTNEIIEHVSITISYEPHENTLVDGECIKDVIKIYLKLKNNKSNYLDVKYTLIHELTHIFQKIKKNKIKNLTKLDAVRYNLLKPSYEQLINEESKHFAHIFYREDIYEISAWCNNGYKEGVKFKLEHPDYSDGEIITCVLSKLNMSDFDIKDVVNYIMYNKKSFNYIIPILIGHFLELTDDGHNEQVFFDKFIFELPVIMKMRREVKEIVSKYNAQESILKIIEIIKKYTPELNEVKDDIINSFIYYIRYWFNEAKAKIAKSVLLGIEEYNVA